jgi:hypothetical protein
LARFIDKMRLFHPARHNNVLQSRGQLMTTIKTALVTAIALLWTCFAPAIARAQAPTLPDWWLAHVEFMTHGGGVWTASNPAGLNDPNAPDAFGMEWRQANDHHVLIGRLYGIEGGRAGTEYWTFREFYHPGERRVVIEQWGGPGIFGRGETSSQGENQGHVEVTFWLPDGRSWREGHRNIELGDTYVTDSFDIDDNDAWTANGHYVWQRQSGGVQ